MKQSNWWKHACAACVLWAAAATTLSAQTFTTLFNFDGSDGEESQAGLIQGSDGNLYGTTLYGGAGEVGTVFKITPSGMLTTLYGFTGTDGAGPAAALVQAGDGSFYGTTDAGGTPSTFCPDGCGTVFKITPSGKLTTLHSFDLADGDQPQAALVQAMDGNFYGTTTYGGVYLCTFAGAYHGCGTVFRMTPDGTLTTLHRFCSHSACADGQWPYGGLVQAANGDLYGTTFAGGSSGSDECFQGCGTVFKITPNGSLTIVHSFDATDGGNSYTGLVQATDGSLYGTTSAGGSHDEGTIFKITLGGRLRTVYNFCSQAACTDGYGLFAALIQATDGNFYGTTGYGGATNGGTIFKITPEGGLTTLYSFCPQGGCSAPNVVAGLVQATNGEFYGTTALDGANDDGTVYSLSVGLGPFVETQPASGKVGATIRILGTNLTGASSVTFNGTPASFRVKSSSEIGAVVLVGAATGTVQVVTPGGTLSSNVPFRVEP